MWFFSKIGISFVMQNDSNLCIAYSIIGPGIGLKFLVLEEMNFNFFLSLIFLMVMVMAEILSSFT